MKEIPTMCENNNVENIQNANMNNNKNINKHTSQNKYNQYEAI